MKKILVVVGVFIAFVFALLIQDGLENKQRKLELETHWQNSRNSMDMFSESKGEYCLSAKYVDLSHSEKKFGDYSRNDLGNIPSQNSGFFCPNPPKNKLIYQCDYLEFFTFGALDTRYNDRTNSINSNAVDNYSIFLEITPFNDSGIEDVYVETELISIFSPKDAINLNYQSDLVTVTNRKIKGLISGQTNNERKLINFGDNFSLELFLDRTDLSLSTRNPGVRKSTYNSPCGGFAEPKCKDDLQISQCIAIDEEDFVPNLMQTADKIETLLTSFRQSERLKQNRLNEKDKKLKDDFKL